MKGRIVVTSTMGRWVHRRETPFFTNTVPLCSGWRGMGLDPPLNCDKYTRRLYFSEKREPIKLFSGVNVTSDLVNINIAFSSSIMYEFILSTFHRLKIIKRYVFEFSKRVLASCMAKQDFSRQRMWCPPKFISLIIGWEGIY